MARMGYVGITDGATGLDVNWQDTPDVAGADGHVAFAVHPVASGLSRTAAHHVLILLAFNEGPDNDVARISVDGAKAITATTWENYYRTDTEAAGSNHRVPVSDSLMFGSRRNPDPALQGKGLLFDDVRISTPRISPTAPAPSTPTPVPPADNAGFTTIAPVTVNNNTNNSTSVPVEATSESAGIRVRKATLDRKDGELKLELYCPVESGLCSGSLSLRGNQRNLAAKGFNQIGGAKFPLTLHLSGDARKQLRSSAKVQALMTSRDSEGIATRLTRTFTR